LDRSSFGRKARAAGFDGKARSAERLLAPDFKSARISMAHQKVPAVPEIATAASMAVKREAPNKVIAAIRRCSPYCALCHAFIVAPRPWHTRESAYPLHGDKEHAMPPFLCRPIAPEIRPNTTFLARGRRRRLGAVGARVRLARRTLDCSACVECTKSKIRCGLDPNKIGSREWAAGDASFFDAPSFFLRQCVSVVERCVSP
jgi:hypothetical protein